MVKSRSAPSLLSILMVKSPPPSTPSSLSVYRKLPFSFPEFTGAFLLMVKSLFTPSLLGILMVTSSLSILTVKPPASSSLSVPDGEARSAPSSDGESVLSLS